MCYFQVGKNFHNKHLLLLQKRGPGEEADRPWALMLLLLRDYAS